MPVQAQLDTPGRVAADFEEQRAELFVVDIEIVVVHVNRLVTVELELSVDFPAVESLRFLLRHSDEHDPIPHRALAAEFVGNVVFSLLMPELVNRNGILLRQCLYCFTELFRDLPQDHG